MDAAPLFLDLLLIGLDGLGDSCLDLFRADLQVHRDGWGRNMAQVCMRVHGHHASPCRRSLGIERGYSARSHHNADAAGCLQGGHVQLGGADLLQVLKRAVKLSVVL